MTYSGSGEIECDIVSYTVSKLLASLLLFLADITFPRLRSLYYITPKCVPLDLVLIGSTQLALLVAFTVVVDTKFLRLWFCNYINLENVLQKKYSPKDAVPTRLVCTDWYSCHRTR